MVELTVLFLGIAAIGFLRPRWSTLWVALGPTALAFAWLVMHEDIPSDPLGPGDYVAYAVMSAIAGLAFALACAAGVVARRLAERGRRDALG